MPRRIGLLRHASAVHEAPSGHDRDRELSQLGQREATLVGTWMAREGLSFPRVLASPAARTMMTAKAVAACMGRPPPVVPEPTIYDAHEPDLVRLLEANPGDVLLVGHNPAISELAQHLTEDHSIRERGMVKAGLVILDMGGPVTRSGVRAYRYVTPRSLQAPSARGAQDT